jgi:membrane fusion protein, heavy metal efflux system
VVERAGRTETTVSAPMTGIVTRIWPIRGEAVSPGAPLFELRLTHEDLVERQSLLLKSLEELDVVNREVARLEHVAADGAIAGKTLLERQYERSKIEAGIRAEKQGLALHGLTPQQIGQIESQRQLVQTITVLAPPLAEDMCCHSHEAFYQVTQLSVKTGDHVVTGTPLATVADHCELHIEGKAFEQDAPALNAAAKAKATVTALVEEGQRAKQEIRGLSLVYVESEIDRESRALRFYVSLPNELVSNEKRPDGHRFVAWRFRPGQRAELLLPVEHWKDRVVLPVEAVVQEGAESYVYRLEGKRFVRRPVHVEYRDQRSVVLEPDANLAVGDVVAVKGAYQIHLALKNKAGGGVDPHAGHNH